MLQLPPDIYNLVAAMLSPQDLCRLRRACRGLQELPVSLRHRRVLLPTDLHSGHICSRAVVGKCNIFYLDDPADASDCGHRLIQVDMDDGPLARLLMQILRAVSRPFYYRDYMVSEGSRGRLYIEQTYLWRDGVRVVYDVVEPSEK
jgi:hypothetical protein